MIGYLLFAVTFGLLLLGIHRKAIARIQRRPGPPIWQEILHMLKFSFKSTWIPATASDTLFVGVVLVAIGIWSAALFVLLAGGSILIIFGIYMLHKIVEHGFGLSSGSPYGKFGGVRSVISAASEIPLFVSVAVVALYTQSLDISSIIQYQKVNGPLLFIVPLAAVAMYLVILSKMPFGPFSIVESKELVSGYKTEHFGVWRAGLQVSNGLKTYVLMFLFIIVFIGGIPLWLTLAGMILLTITLSFVCAMSPMLSPFDSVTVQMIITGIMVAYAAVLGVFA
ncbi:MAG: respiratory chain complex I subunit 1 family protein [Methanomicrobiales archaeon]|jgi:energy-converting hydrogenase A subunit J|nr:NADH-quinone oxidoreductase subunit H [Burkholderiaceae bacterium]HMZ31360.1 NADH-quinone oxidoreductase subunit H [Methanoregulaceae archaeon]HNI41494.1 NADH-quinone oxidoreductase subunit H [Methanoregulaceae archaeon]HNL86073.1 NADH-quinone oxidoreductase subunit H [Methanoregulaceae archaeon]HNO07489.1 NADH-quinone oxidoreductase subunit H [Methanoregulaceae archaeon]